MFDCVEQGFELMNWQSTSKGKRSEDNVCDLQESLKSLKVTVSECVIRSITDMCTTIALRPATGPNETRKEFEKTNVAIFKKA